MIYATLTLRLLHILFMATWAGSVLFSTGDIKRTVAEPTANLPLLRDRIGRNMRFAGLSGVMTLVTGFGLIAAMGGMAVVAKGIHWGMLLGFVLLGLGSGGLGRTWSAIEQGIEAGHSAEQLTPLIKRMGMLTGLFHLTWLVALILMVFRNLVP